MAPGEDERREQQALQADPEERRVGLAVVAARERRELERAAGSPRRVMRPACASATTSANICSIASAGRTSTRSRASSSPALAKECMTPGATSMTSPGPASRVRSPTRKRIWPAWTSKRSVWMGWTWGMGTAPPGRSAKSKASSSPPVVAAVSMKVKRSPVTGFSSVRPGRISSVLVCMFDTQARIGETVHGQYAQPHARSSTLDGMDAVAGLLDGPRAREAFLLRASLDPPWSLRIQDEAPLTVVAVLRGAGHALYDDGEQTLLGPGDVAIFRGPDPYIVADDPATAPQAVIHPGQRCTTPDGRELAELGELGVRTWGNNPDGATVMLVGTYQLEGEVSRRLLRALPRLLVLRAAEWDCPLIPLLSDEIVKDEPGQEAVLDRLLDLLLIAVLRAWFARPEAGAPAGTGPTPTRWSGRLCG